MDSNEYRHIQVREWQSELKTVIDMYQSNVKRYRRRVTVLGIMVYSVSAVVVSAEVVLSAISPIGAAVNVTTICVSSSTTPADVFGIIAKKLSSCANIKLHDYTIKLNTATVVYQKLSLLISSSLDARSSSGRLISDSEFKSMEGTYNDFLHLNLMSSDLKYAMINNNGKGTTSTNSHKYNTGENHNDLSILD